MSLLLTPVCIGAHTAKNRIVLPPMETRLNHPDGASGERAADYYATRAKGGAGMVIVENTFVDAKESRSSLSSSGIYNDHMIASKARLAEVIKENGALAILQIAHGGRQAAAQATGLTPVAPSAISCKETDRMPRALKIQEIEEIEDAFAAAALRAQKAGFHGVEVHGAHGYLISSFLSPHTNKRKDRYGGSTENRARFAVNIVQKIRAQTGRSFIVGFRINGSDYIEGGLEAGEAAEIARILEGDIDYIHVTAGMYETPCCCSVLPSYLPGGNLAELAAQVKSRVKIPVVAVGSIGIEAGEKLLKEKKADMIAMGRALIADPMLPNKLSEGRAGDIRPCIRAGEGCASGMSVGRPMRCEVNPACGREKDYMERKTMQPKKLLVIGGGPAGMEAARVACLLGHSVTLAEKTGQLGGHLKEAAQPDFKKEIASLLAWQIRQIEKSNVKVLFNTVFGTKEIEQTSPDAVILATGSRYALPAVTGIENAMLPDAVLMGAKTGRRVAVIGCGLIGAEVALHLSRDPSKEITVFKRKPEILGDMESNARAALLSLLQQAEVKILTGHTVTEIRQGGVVCSHGGENVSFAADTIINAAGLIPQTQSEKELGRLSMRVIKIGDCAGAGKLYGCFHGAWQAVFSLGDEPFL